jgi:hypothetical protein
MQANIKSDLKENTNLLSLEEEYKKAKEGFLTAYTDYMPLKNQDEFMKKYIIPTENELMFSTINQKSIVSGDKAWEKATKYRNVIASTPGLSSFDEELRPEKEEVELIKKYADSYQKEFFTAREIINISGEYKPHPTDNGEMTEVEDLVLSDIGILKYDEPYNQDTKGLIYNVCTFAPEWKNTVFYKENGIFHELLLPCISNEKCGEKIRPLSADVERIEERRLNISDYDHFALTDNIQKANITKNEVHNPDHIYPCLPHRVAGFCSSKNYYTTQKIYTVKRNSGRGHSIQEFKDIAATRGINMSAPRTLLSFFGFCKCAEAITDQTYRLTFIDPTGEYTVVVKGKEATAALSHLCAFTVEFTEGESTSHPYSMFIYPADFLKVNGNINKETTIISF